MRGWRTMTRHGDSHIDVDLQLMPDPFIDFEAVCRFAKQELGQLEPDEDGDDQA